MHPARFQTGVDERELQDRSRDGRIVDPQVARRTIAHHHHGRRSTRERHGAVVAHGSHTVHRRGVAHRQKPRRTAVARRGGVQCRLDRLRQYFVRDLLVPEFAHGTPCLDHLLKVHKRNVFDFRDKYRTQTQKTGRRRAVIFIFCVLLSCRLALSLPLAGERKVRATQSTVQANDLIAVRL